MYDPWKYVPPPKIKLLHLRIFTNKENKFLFSVLIPSFVNFFLNESLPTRIVISSFSNLKCFAIDINRRSSPKLYLP